MKEESTTTDLETTKGYKKTKHACSELSEVICSPLNFSSNILLKLY